MPNGNLSVLPPAFYQPVADCPEIYDAPLCSKPTPEKVSLLKKIGRVVLTIFKNMLLMATGAFFFWLNPTFFVIGFFTGILLENHISNAIKKVKNVWAAQTAFACSVGIVAGYLALPVVLATGSIFGGAYLGSRMSLKANGSVALKV